MTSASASALATPPATTPIAPTEHTMKLWDGSDLFYRAWIPAAPTDKALILFHRGHEHSGRFADVVAELGLRDVAVFAWDARGHGRSPGLRGYAPSFGAMVKDADSFVRHICETYGKKLENTVILAHSVGAVTATAWIHDYAPPIRGLILATPALRVKLYIPFAIPGLRVMRKLKGAKPGFVKSYVKSKMLTHDPVHAKAYDDDKLIAKAIAVNVLLDMYDAATRLIADAGAIRVPTLVMSGGADWVVRVDTQKKFFDRLGSPIKKMRIFDGMYHDILHEKNREPAMEEIRQFIAQVFAQPRSKTPLLDADERGYTRTEYDQLLKPLPALSPKSILFAINRFGLNTVCRLSAGVRIGWATGFDSGLSLDHVYKNRAKGGLLLGKIIDRFYLDTPGWRGIRQRKINLEAMLDSAIQRTRAEKKPVRILDIATGCGRYVLDTLKRAGGVESALLRDFTPANLEEGRQIAAEMGLTQVRFEQGDAFDVSSLAAITPPPTVSIVSGLYELFPDNKRVLGSLRGVAAAMKEGGYLVYTGQPWHPQLEFIARVLINRDGKPWIMRRRTQEELDSLVAAAGFEKIAMEIDEAGIFTVSLARRINA